VGGAAPLSGCAIKRQIEGCAQLKTARPLLLRDGDCNEECILGQRRIRPIALEQNLAATVMQESVARVAPVPRLERRREQGMSVRIMSSPKERATFGLGTFDP
jgi:hypothetical protein